MIIFYILTTLSLDNVWTLLGENCCWSLLGLKGLNNVGQNSFQISAQLQSVLIVFNFIRPSVPCYVFLSGSKMFRPLVLRLFKCSFGYSCWPGWELRSIMTRLDKFMIPVPFLTTRFSMDC